MTRTSRRQILAAGALLAGGVGSAALAQQSPTPSRLTPPAGPIPAAFVMDNAATMIDFAGPWEAFQDAMVASVPGFHLYTVAATRDEMQTTGGHAPDGTMTGMRFLPDYTFDDAPAPRVVVIGAQARGRMPEKIEWIRHVAAQADIVMSVCTGAFILARTGLLDGLIATTHHQFFEQFEQQFPSVRLVRGRRFVDNGKFVTSGGLTSGVDAALHVVARYYGQEAAQRSADYMEHHGDGWLTGVQPT